MINPEAGSVTWMSEPCLLTDVGGVVWCGELSRRSPVSQFSINKILWREKKEKGKKKYSVHPSTSLSTGHVAMTAGLVVKVVVLSTIGDG